MTGLRLAGFVGLLLVGLVGLYFVGSVPAQENASPTAAEDRLEKLQNQAVEIL